MSSLRLFWRVIRSIHADGVFIGYLVFILLCCVLFCLWEPDVFPTYGSAIWYVFQMITTIGFGDIVARSQLCQALSVVIGLTSLVIVALITGTIVSYFEEKTKVRSNESFLEFGHRMEHLTELSSEELAETQEQYLNFVHRVRGAKKS